MEKKIAVYYLVYKKKWPHHKNLDFSQKKKHRKNIRLYESKT